MLSTNISTLPTLKSDLSDIPFIKYDIVEVNVKFSPKSTPIGIVTQYCEHHNMIYISQSENNIPWYHEFPDRNRTNVWILSIFRKKQQQFNKVQNIYQVIIHREVQQGKFHHVLHR